MAPQRCTATTNAGRPCKAWSVPGTDPPTCRSHAPPPPQAAFYSAALTTDELAALLAAEDLTLDDEIACARVALRRIMQTIHPENDTGLNHTDFRNYITLLLQATRTIARLLRDKRALTGEAADGISAAIAQALDELGTELGLPL